MRKVSVRYRVDTHFISEVIIILIAGKGFKTWFNAWVIFIILIQLVIHAPNFKTKSDECTKRQREMIIIQA